jgi:hypothetical protein
MCECSACCKRYILYDKNLKCVRCGANYNFIVFRNAAGRLMYIKDHHMISYDTTQLIGRVIFSFFLCHGCNSYLNNSSFIERYFKSRVGYKKLWVFSERNEKNEVIIPIFKKCGCGENIYYKNSDVCLKCFFVFEKLDLVV